MFSRAMKEWLVGLALVIVLGAAGVGLWVTWDSTQTSADSLSDSLSTTAGGPLVTTTTAGLRATTTTLPPPPCEAGDEPVERDPTTDWATTVIDTGHRLAPDFAPGDLVDVNQAGFDSHDRVRSFVIADLAALGEAAEANGTPIVVISAYRSYDYQANLFANRTDEVGEAEAALRTARPGHSEHQLGTAIDVLDPGVGDLTAAFAQTPAGQWVAAHAHEYGFVPSYPDGARDRTCYDFEPWHLRYVGRDIAAEIHESGLTAREWMLADRADAAG
jgi:zinc D-Ala-D-Ala carboxypeptidase